MAKPSKSHPAARKTTAAFTPKRTAAWTIGAVVVAAGAGVAAFLTRGRIAALFDRDADEGHVPTDLLDPSRNADDRAVADFRPDMDAVMTTAEREALRPATVPAPSLTTANGSISATNHDD